MQEEEEPEEPASNTRVEATSNARADASSAAQEDDPEGDFDMTSCKHFREVDRASG